MKKRILILLACLVLAASVSCRAEGNRWEVRLGDATYFVGWWFCPLDAHNAVVIARTDKDKPWHVGWYRDGEMFRDLAGYTENVYLEDCVIPRPVVWDGEHLTMLYSVRKGEYRTTVKDGIHTADPENYDTYLAEWTENGLENPQPVPDTWYDTCELGRVMISRSGDVFSLRIDGKDEILPADVPGIPMDEIHNLSCMPVSEGKYLVKYMAGTDFNYTVSCVDHGKKRYEVSLTEEEDWFVWPDADGGFFIRVGWPAGDYAPVQLAHYNADGERDRTPQIRGDRVVIKVSATRIDAETGNTILYGSAVANSRRVFTAFAMTLDRNLNVCGLDVRDFDPVYHDYAPDIEIAPDGTAYLMIGDLDGRVSKRPMIIPFDELEKSGDDHGLTLE